MAEKSQPMALPGRWATITAPTTMNAAKASVRANRKPGRRWKLPLATDRGNPTPVQATKMPTMAQATQVERLPIASPPWSSWNRRSASWTADRAVPLLPGLTGVVETKQGIRLGEADLQTGDADQHREQALDLAEGPGEGAAERTVRPHSASPMLELVFEKR
jgi:hypothetical protein